MEAFQRAAPLMPEGLGKTYSDVVLTLLPKVAAQKFLEGLMAVGTDEYKSDYVRQWVAEGQAEGTVKTKAKDIIVVLRARELHVSPEAENRILTCTDLDQLSAWLPKAAVVSSTEDLFS